MAKKNRPGRPSKYNPEFCQKIIQFFDREPYDAEHLKELITLKDGTTKEVYDEKPCDIPLFSTFAVKVADVTHDTLLEWCKVHPEFSESYKKAKNLQESILVINAMRGNYEQPFSIFTSKNILDWRDRTEIVEIKFVYEFVSKITEAMNRVIPNHCPHCRKALSLREETIKELEQISKTMDDVKTV